jgi:hypothetical protein
MKERIMKRIQRKECRPGMVIHICNPNYLGGKDWEDHHARSAMAKSLQDSISTDGWA